LAINAARDSKWLVENPSEGDATPAAEEAGRWFDAARHVDAKPKGVVIVTPERDAGDERD
jgi:hypothetical protein